MLGEGQWLGQIDRRPRYIVFVSFEPGRDCSASQRKVCRGLKLESIRALPRTNHYGSE